MTDQRLKDISDPSFSPFLADEVMFGDIADPWPLMAEFRKTAPVSKGEFVCNYGGQPDPSLIDRQHYSVWTHDALTELFSDTTRFSNELIFKIAVEKAFGRMLLVMDPPEHSRYRLYLQTVFSPRAIQAWTNTLIRPLVHRLIDEFEADGHAELVSQFTRRFPFDLVFGLLDLPKGDVDLFYKLAVTQTFVMTPFVKEALEAGGNLAEYFEGLVAERRASPGDDLISRMTQTEIGGERLDDGTLIAFLRHILNASADTSFRTTGSLMVALLSEPALFAEVRSNPELIPAAIEETLRWDGPVVTSFRAVERDTELAGVAMERGSVVHAVFSSGNRDEARFTNPAKFDLHRGREGRHFGFGGGAHICVGMHLARLQIREAVAALLERLPNLRLDPEKAPPVIKGFRFRSPPELHVVF